MARLKSDLARRLHRRAANLAMRLRRPQVARIDTKGNRLTLHLAGRTRFLELSRELPAFDTFDFAVFALAAMGMRRGIPVRLDLPVSESAARAVAHLGTIMRQRAPDLLSPLDLELTHIVADRAPGKGGIMCLSGGLDSTHLSLTLPGFTHGLSIEGFDFPIGSKGFVGRRKRIQTIADHVGFEVIDLVSDLSSSMYPFSTMNIFYFTACLHFAAYGLGKGALSTDQSVRAMPMITDHGMVIGMDNHVSTRSFPIHVEGWRDTRGEKAAAVHRLAPELMRVVAFCLNSLEDGGNCGTCEKCMRMRFCMDYTGLDQRLVFPDVRDPIPFFETVSFHTSMRTAINIERLAEGIDVMPDSDARRRLIRVCEVAREKHFGVRNPKVNKGSNSGNRGA